LATYDGSVEIIRFGRVIATGEAHLEPAEEAGGESGWSGAIALDADYRYIGWRPELITLRLMPSGLEAPALIVRVPTPLTPMEVTSAPGAAPFWD